MSKSTRRRFLQSAGLTSAAPFAAGAAVTNTSPTYHDSGFAPQSAPRKISGNLFLFEDTCNVYVVRDGANCVLIDFGSGRILDHLRDLGISKVDQILHTHHHRDQCQGDRKAVARSIPRHSGPRDIRRF